jgi:hypothetical protein
MLNALHESTREQIAKREIGRTDVAPGVAVFLTALFLATVFAVPVLQHLDDVREFTRGARADWVPHCYSIAAALPAGAATYRDSPGGPVRRIVAANRNLLRTMRHYETGLEESSWLSRVFLPPAQWLLTRRLRAGTETVYLGRRGWLFYRPDVDYAAGPGFLTRRHNAGRRTSAKEWERAPQPDPVRAIVQFNDRLHALGIRLLVMPTPLKPTIHPDRFSRALEHRRGALQNASFPAFLDRLQDAGVAVFDCAPFLSEAARETGRPQYLAADTHWRPEAMERVAQRLATAVLEAGALPPRGAVDYRREAAAVSGAGDLRLMLKFPPALELPELETVHIQPVLFPGGELWSPDRTAEILVLGDSFSNIYSLPSMGWGAAAGLVEQLSYHLQRPVDRIVQNDNGAYATRETLSIDTPAGRERLEGKRVVVWQFAARELSFGDWKED